MMRSAFRAKANVWLDVHMSKVFLIKLDLKHQYKLESLLKLFEVQGILPTPLGRIITVQGAVNDKLHLPGINETQAQRFSDKLAVHQSFAGKCHQARYVALSESLLMRLLQEPQLAQRLLAQAQSHALPAQNQSQVLPDQTRRALVAAANPLSTATLDAARISDLTQALSSEQLTSTATITSTTSNLVDAPTVDGLSFLSAVSKELLRLDVPAAWQQAEIGSEVGAGADSGSYSELEQVVLELSKLAYPVVIKPRYGSGSRGVNVAQTLAELLPALKIGLQEFQPLSGLSRDLLVEEFLLGQEYSCYGIVLNHKLYAPTLLKKVELTPLPFRQEIAYVSGEAEIEPEAQAVILAEVQSSITALGLTDCLLVADVMLVETKAQAWVEHDLSETEAQIESDSSDTKVEVTPSAKSTAAFKHTKLQAFVLDISGRHCGYSIIEFLDQLKIDYLQLWHRYILSRRAIDLQLLKWNEQHLPQNMYLHFFLLPTGIVRYVPKLSEIQALIAKLCGLASKDVSKHLVEYRCSLVPGDKIVSTQDGRVCDNGFLMLAGLSLSAYQTISLHVQTLFQIEVI